MYYSVDNLGVVRKIRRSDGAVMAQLDDVRGKAIAVDDQGRVYLAEGDAIDVYDADFTKLREKPRRSGRG